MRGNNKRCVTHFLLLIAVSVLVCPLSVSAQSRSDISEAIEQLAQSSDDTAAEKLLIDNPGWASSEVAAGALQKAHSILSADFKKALSYAKVTLLISTKLNDKRLKIRSLYLLAFGDLRAGSFDSALRKYDECFQLG